MFDASTQGYDPVGQFDPGPSTTQGLVGVACTLAPSGEEALCVGGGNDDVATTARVVRFHVASRTWLPHNPDYDFIQGINRAAFLQFSPRIPEEMQSRIILGFADNPYNVYEFDVAQARLL